MQTKTEIIGGQSGQTPPFALALRADSGRVFGDGKRYGKSVGRIFGRARLHGAVVQARGRVARRGRARRPVRAEARKGAGICEIQLQKARRGIRAGGSVAARGALRQKLAHRRGNRGARGRIPRGKHEIHRGAQPQHDNDFRRGGARDSNRAQVPSPTPPTPATTPYIPTAGRNSPTLSPARCAFATISR